MSEDAQRAGLLLYTSLLFLLQAALIRRSSGLGWSIAASNVALSVLYVYEAAAMVWQPGLETHDTVQSLLRLGVAATVTWAVWELARGRRWARSAGRGEE